MSQGSSWIIEPSTLEGNLRAKKELIAPLLVAAVLTRSAVTLKGIDPKQWELAAKELHLLEQMGGRFDLNSRRGEVVTAMSPQLSIDMEIGVSVKTLPLLILLATLRTMSTELYPIDQPTAEESQTLRIVCTELQKMGVKLERGRIGVKVTPTRLIGATVSTHDDPKAGTVLALAGLVARGQTRITEAECISSLYPTLVHDLLALGAQIRKVRKTSSNSSRCVTISP